MKLAAAATVFYLCAPALADPPPSPPSSIKIHFALRDAPAAPRTFDVVVAPSAPCATVDQKQPDHEIALTACASNRLLDLRWYSRTAAGEYRSQSSIALAHGTTAQLGSGDGPRLEVTIP